MKPLHLVRTLIILFSLSGSGSLFAGMNLDGTITFQSGQIQYSSSFSWGQPFPNESDFGFVSDAAKWALTPAGPNTTVTYSTPAIASSFANTFTQHIQPICGGVTQAVVSGTSVIYTVEPTTCYIRNNNNTTHVYIYKVTTPGGWTNCKSTAISPQVKRKVTSSLSGIIYDFNVRANESRNYDADGALISATTAELTIASGNNLTATTYRKVPDYETIINITETPLGVGSPNRMSCAGMEYVISSTALLGRSNGYIRFSSGLSTDHVNIISSTLQGDTSQQVNNRVISPALDVIPSATINVGSIAGFTYPEWHEYPFQITAISNVEYNVGASIDFPVLVRWTCTPPTGNVNFEIRSPSGTNLCNGQETSHPAVTTPLDVRAAWRPSSASATGTWSAAATVEYILP